MLNVLSPSGIEDLHSKRIELNRQIRQEEEEKERLQHDIQVLSDKLSRVNESLSQRIAARAAFDRIIAETEAAYTKVCFCTKSYVLLLLCPTIILYLTAKFHKIMFQLRLPEHHSDPTNKYSKAVFIKKQQPSSDLTQPPYCFLITCPGAVSGSRFSKNS